MSRVIGMTGPTGAGKSSAAKAAEKLGIRVIDCDLLARKAVEPESKGLGALVSVFGNEILGEDGSLDRKKLAEKAFSSPEKTELLNKTILPFIADMIKELVKDGDALLDAPTLFESGADSICDDTVAVLADSGIRLERIISRDNLTLNQAQLRMSAGKPDRFYQDRAGHILYNDGDITAFIEKSTQLFKELFGGKCDE